MYPPGGTRPQTWRPPLRRSEAGNIPLDEPTRLADGLGPRVTHRSFERFAPFGWVPRSGRCPDSAVSTLYSRWPLMVPIHGGFTKCPFSPKCWARNQVPLLNSGALNVRCFNVCSCLRNSLSLARRSGSSRKKACRRQPATPHNSDGGALDRPEDVDATERKKSKALIRPAAKVTGLATL